MGWDYYTYEAQPAHFLEEIAIFLKQEGARQRRDEKKAKRGVK